MTYEGERYTSIRKFKAVVVQYYVSDPESDHTIEVAELFDARDVVESICEKWWPRYGDYCTTFDVVITAPEKFAGKYPVVVESVPHFAIGKKQ